MIIYRGYIMSKLINKILLIMSTILILFVVSFSAVFGYLFFQHSQNIESSRLESTALSLADILSKSTGNNPLTNIYNANVLQLVNILEQGEIWLVDKNTLQIVGSRFNPALTYDQLPAQAANDLQSILNGQNIRTQTFNIYTQPHYTTVGVPIYDSEGNVKGALLFHSKMPTLKFSWYDGIALMLFCSIVLFVILILLLKVLLKKYVLPLEVLNQFIEKILHHNYTSHIKTKANDEIAQLAQNLNRLSLYLQNLETTSKAKAQSDNNLIIKTAYKLHTPLKELKHDIHELAQKKSNIPESNLKQMQKNIDKLDMIANNLLDLSQLDNKDFILQKDLLNLIEILQDSIKAREKVAKEQNIKIDLKISLAKEIILFTGDKNRLKQMFCETLDKALQIYPQKSDLIIKILEDDNNYYIYMQNNNDEISVEHLPEMFPQFYQTAEDDTILNSIELKIAQHLASLHQIKLTTEKQSDKYTVFKFTISK